MAEAARAHQHLLYVLRHAKSSWKEPDQEDHERPLAPRGRKAARGLSRYLERSEIRPSLVLCSPARRARETYDRVAPSGELLLEPALYNASAAEIVERLREIDDSTDSVMVIGHNPGLQLLLLWLTSADSPPQGRGEQMPALETVREKFPTCALATVRFSGPWRRLGPGRGELAGLVRPADLS